MKQNLKTTVLGSWETSVGGVLAIGSAVYAVFTNPELLANESSALSIATGIIGGLQLIFRAKDAGKVEVPPEGK